MQAAARIIVKVWFYALFVALMATSASALETIEYAKTFSVRHLAGVVRDLRGAVVSNVKVEVCNVGWSDCFATTTTGPNGAFFFPNPPSQKLYYVRMSADGFDPLRMKVRLRAFGHKRLAVKTYVAT